MKTHIDLSTHKARASTQTKIDKKHSKARALLPKDEQSLYKTTQRLIIDLSHAYRGKTLDNEVVKSWLYEHGLSDHRARLVLWNAAGNGIIRFDKDWNIECGGPFEVWD